MADQPVELGILHLVGNFFCGKGLFARRAPDINAPCINNEKPGGDPGEFLAQRVKGQFIVGGDKNRGVVVRIADAVQTRGNAVIIPGKAGSCAQGAEAVADGQGGGNPWYRADWRLDKVLNKGINNITGASVSTGPWRRFRASAGGVGHLCRRLQGRRGAAIKLVNAWQGDDLLSWRFSHGNLFSTRMAKPLPRSSMSLSQSSRPILRRTMVLPLYRDGVVRLILAAVSRLA